MSLLIEAPSQTFDLRQYPEQNTEDVRAYLRNYLIPHLSPQTEEDAQSWERSNLKSWLTRHNISQEEFCDRLQSESENNFMYLSQIISAITEDFYPEPFQRHQLPPALETYYQQHWQKMIIHGLSPVALGVLRVLTSEVQAPGISASAIARILDEDEYVVEEVLENWYEFLQVKQVEGEIYYNVYHSSFRVWLAKQMTQFPLEDYLKT